MSEQQAWSPSMPAPALQLRGHDDFTIDCIGWGPTESGHDGHAAAPLNFTPAGLRKLRDTLKAVPDEA